MANTQKIIFDLVKLHHFLMKMAANRSEIPEGPNQNNKEIGRCHTRLQGKVQTTVAGRLRCCERQNILINYKGSVCFAAAGAAEPDQLIMLAGRIDRSQPDCWCYEITTA